MQVLINIDVDDLERAIAFYRDAFDLRPGRSFGDDGMEMLGAEVPIYLLLKPSGSLAGPMSAQSREYRRLWTPVQLDLAVDDVDAAGERAVAAGATLEQPPAQEPYGRLALLADPFGHGFCLIEFVGRGYDEIAG